MASNPPLSEELLLIWMYKYLLGTLASAKVDLLEAELKKRDLQKKTRTALERKLYAAFIIQRPTRKYLAELLNDWERRISGKN